jgi:hypothetical protein
MTSPPLGIIEGYYGDPWSWADREATLSCLARHDYSFYIYAPKADAFLRRRWQEDHPADSAGRLAALAACCRRLGLRFGVGLSPYELHADFSTAARAALTRKLAFFDTLGIDDLAILFDDMRGGFADLAHRQVAIVDWIAARTAATRIVVCPSYYSDDPVLDRISGPRPAGYLETLGAALAPAIDIFWTGEQVCSTGIAPDHLRAVGAKLRRKPLLWDNYPVNDGRRMSQHLHLRAFQDRPAAIGALLAGHGVNPALQPGLTCIPALTLAALYRDGAAYRPAEAWLQAATAVLGDAAMARLLQSDIGLLQDTGLDNLSADQQAALRARYGGAGPGSAAREIIRWLDGDYRVTEDLILTQ